MSNTPKKDTLKNISNELKNIDFSSFDPRKDKVTLMKKLEIVNSQLGKLLRGFENATS